MVPSTAFRHHYILPTPEDIKMPLFLKKETYKKGDLVVSVSPRSLNNDSITILLGTINPLTLKHSQTHIEMAAKRHYNLIVFPLIGRHGFYASNGSTCYSSDDVIVGVVSGTLDLKDRYEVKRYLKQCASILVPQYLDIEVPSEEDDIWKRS